MASNRYGQARREVIALKPLINQRLESGHSIRQIWLELRSEGRISVALCNFYIQVARLQKDAKANIPTIQPTGRDLVALAASPSPVIVPVFKPAAFSPEDAITRRFDHPKLPCEADLVGTKKREQ